MESLALDLIEYIKEENNFYDDEKFFYKRCMYALEDAEYIATLPYKFLDQKIVEDAWDICRVRCMLLSPVAHHYDDVIPKYLLSSVNGVAEYFTELVLNEIENHINEAFPDNYEYIRSDAIESVIKAETLENCEELLADYIEYMREEYNQDIEVYNNHGNPYIVKYGRITEKASLDYEKIVEISGTSGSDYFNIEFEWGV